MVTLSSFWLFFPCIIFLCPFLCLFTGCKTLSEINCFYFYTCFFLEIQVLRTTVIHTPSVASACLFTFLSDICLCYLFNFLAHFGTSYLILSFTWLYKGFLLYVPTEIDLLTIWIISASSNVFDIWKLLLSWFYATM